MITTPVRHIISAFGGVLLLASAAQQLCASPYEDEDRGPEVKVSKAAKQVVVPPKVQHIYDTTTGFNAKTGFRQASPEVLFWFMPKARSDVHVREAMKLWVARHFQPEQLDAHFNFITETYTNDDPKCVSDFMPQYAALLGRLEKAGDVSRADIQAALIKATSVLVNDPAKNPDFGLIERTVRALHRNGFGRYMDEEYRLAVMEKALSISAWRRNWAGEMITKVINPPSAPTPTKRISSSAKAAL